MFYSVIPIFLGRPQGHGLNAEEEHPGSDEDHGQEVEGRELKGRQESKTFSENFVQLKQETTEQGGMKGAKVMNGTGILHCCAQVPTSQLH